MNTGFDDKVVRARVLLYNLRYTIIKCVGGVCHYEKSNNTNFANSTVHGVCWL